MSKRRKSANSVTAVFWDLVQQNPELAAGLAFQLGSLVGQAVHGATARRLQKNGHAAFRAMAKSVHDAPAALARTLPEMPNLARLPRLPFLAGASPKLQPNKRTAAPRSKKARKTA